MPGAARIGDMTTHCGAFPGNITTSASKTTINDMPAARVGDTVVGVPHCHSVHPWSPIPHPITGNILSGSTTVLIENMPAARTNDPGSHAACCGPNNFTIKVGSTNVLIG